MSSIISFLANQNGLKTPIYDNVEFAIGCDLFLFRGKTESDCWKLYDDFLYSVPTDKQVRAYKIGLRPDYPVPVSRYFIEVCVADRGDPGLNLFWTRIENGRLIS